MLGCFSGPVTDTTVTYRSLFGESAEVHRPHLLASDQPIVVTVIDTPEKIREVLPILEAMTSSGVVALSDVEVTVVSSRAAVPLA